MSFYDELKRRNVFRVGVAYAAISWVILQAVDIILNNVEAPIWMFQTLLLVLGIGFILALFFAWAFEVTPEGIKRESEVDRSQSMTLQTGRKLTLVIVTFASIGAAYFIYNSFISVPDDVAGNATAMTDGASAAAPGTPAVADNTIAVLPFANMSGDPATEPFIMGVHDDLLTHLSRIKALKTTSRTSVGQYRDTTKNIREIASELRVANILEGGIQRSGDRVRINMQLIDGRTDEHLWAEIYDRELTTENLFEVQADIATAVADALSATLLPEEKTALAVAPTQSLEAYDLYLAGRYHWYQQSAESAAEALDFFRQAIAVDPDYVLALSGVADALIALETYGDIPRRESIPEAQQALDHALALDDSVSEVWASLGLLRFRLEDYLGSAEALEQAIELDENNFWAWDHYGRSLYALRRFEESLAAHEMAYTLEPMFRPVNETLAFAHRNRGNFQRAVHHFERVDQLAGQEITQWKEQIARTYLQAGEVARSVSVLRRILALDPGNTDAMSLLIQAYILMGDLDEASLWAERAAAVNALSLEMNFVYIARGQEDVGVQFLEDWMLRIGQRPPPIVGWAFQLSHTARMDESALAYMEEYTSNYPNMAPPFSPYNWSPVDLLPGFDWLINYETYYDKPLPEINGVVIDRTVTRANLDNARANLEALAAQGFKHPETSLAMAAFHAINGEREAVFEHLDRAVAGGLAPRYPLDQNLIFARFRDDHRYQEIEARYLAQLEAQRAALETMELAAYELPVKREVVALPRGVLEAYAGHFTDDNVRLHFYLDERGRFTLRSGRDKPEQMLANADGVFFNPDRASFWRFGRNDTGEVSHVIWEGGGNQVRFKAAPPPPESISLDRAALEPFVGRYLGERIAGAERSNAAFDKWQALVYLDDDDVLWLHFGNQPALVIEPFSATEFHVPGYLGAVQFELEDGATQAHRFIQKWAIGDVPFDRVDEPPTP